MTEKRNEVAITVRFPPDLITSIRQLAARDRRSLNSEIVILLERAAADALSS